MWKSFLVGTVSLISSADVLGHPCQSDADPEACAFDLAQDDEIEAGVSLLQERHNVVSMPFTTGHQAECPLGYQRITFHSQCEKGAKRLGFTYGSSGMSTNSYPTGCIVRTTDKKVFFNLYEGEGSASNYVNPLCETWEEAEKAKPKPFVLSGKNIDGCPSGSKYRNIEYATQCDAASKEYGLTYVGGTSYEGYPRGCVVRDSKAYFNLIQGDGKANTMMAVLCETEKEASHAQPAGFVKTAVGAAGCPSDSKYHNIESASICEKASSKLGLSYNGPTSSSSYPAGCIGKDSNTWFNTVEGQKSSYKYVICETKGSGGGGGGGDGGSSKKVEGHLASKEMDGTCIDADGKEAHHCGKSKNLWLYHTEHFLLKSGTKCLHANGDDVDIVHGCDKDNVKYQWEFEKCKHGKCNGQLRSRKNGKCLHFNHANGKFKLKQCAGSNGKQHFVLK
eukprot:TRINITY_DN15546_c0_g1_i1.p1 TRINITY_DN15546_c0_g1~~TRINITY_DN15546_c0_g1_i1.p1  ORF type:complete len:449 (-),score=48.18 TRINITY_DN15546_c0_g1_i1:100-1446(-)